MALTVTQIFDAYAPAYAGDSSKTNFILLAKDQTNRCFYGTKYNQAVALRAAHMMTLRDRAASGGGGGAISSMKEGDLAISYATSATAKNDDLSQTSYGRLLLGLRRGSSPAIGVTGGNDDGCAS